MTLQIRFSFPAGQEFPSSVFFFLNDTKRADPLQRAFPSCIARPSQTMVTFFEGKSRQRIVAGVRPALRF